MAKFDPAQAVDVLSIYQLINAWAKELDENNGVGVGPMVTEDCAYSVPLNSYQGRADVVKYYEDRLAGLRDSPTGVPVQRHVISNLCVDFTASDSAIVSFVMVYYTA
ncbi:MAG: nuclear transport factor 2 family protein, partial [Novosphingobium sp.]